jgi:hypothetical protein
MTVIARQGLTAGGARARRRGVCAAAAVWCAVLLCGTGLAPAAASPREVEPRVSWGLAAEVPGTAALNAGGDAQVMSLSCWRAGDCVAGGFYTDASKHEQAFLASESGAVWGDAQEVPGSAALNAGGDAQVLSVSCPRDGGCVAGGFYTDAGDHEQAFVVSLSSGVWGEASELPGTAALNAGGDARVVSLSCPSAGSCGAGGDYQRYRTGPGAEQAFVAGERDGRWAAARRAPGLAGLRSAGLASAGVTSVSCPSAGNCAAGGWWMRDGKRHGLVVSEASGRWGGALLQHSGDAIIESVSCWQPGGCAAAGGNFVVTQTNGRWGPLHHFTAVTGGTITAVSCPSAGNCTLAGTQGITGSTLTAPDVFTANEQNGHWHSIYVPEGETGTGELVELWCSSAGDCGIAGAYQVLGDHDIVYAEAFQDGERHRYWEGANWERTAPGTTFGAGPAQASSVSCPTAGVCVAGGFYTICPMPDEQCAKNDHGADPGSTTQAWVDEP